MNKIPDSHYLSKTDAKTRYRLPTGLYIEVYAFHRGGVSALTTGQNLPLAEKKSRFSSYGFQPWRGSLKIVRLGVILGFATC